MTSQLAFGYSEGSFSIPSNRVPHGSLPNSSGQALCVTLSAPSVQELCVRKVLEGRRLSRASLRRNTNVSLSRGGRERLSVVSALVCVCPLILILQRERIQLKPQCQVKLNFLPSVSMPGSYSSVLFYWCHVTLEMEVKRPVWSDTQQGHWMEKVHQVPPGAESLIRIS